MRRPNILLLLSDQHRWDAVGTNGNLDVRTPNLDKLASEGINFDHHFVQNPVCMPSRVSCLTGQYPSKLGITHMAVPVPESTTTLPKVLRPYGYHSANIGKLHFLPHANRDHKTPHPDYGFDHLEISDEPGCYDDVYRAWVKAKDQEQLDNISVGLPPATETWHKTMGIDDRINHPEVRFLRRPVPFPGKCNLTHTSFVTEQTIEFLKQNQGNQFMCIAGFYSPHEPWVVPKEFLDLYNPDLFTLPKFPPEIDAQRNEMFFSDEELRGARHGYYAMISEVDYHIGRILTTLDELELAENTIVIYTSDHGEWLGEHLRYGKGFPGPDCISRVPFIVRWPEGIAEPNRTVSEITEAVDLVPTLLECAGIPLPYFLQGKSMCPVFRERNETHKESAIMEGTGWKTVRTRRYRYVIKASGEENLYDLASDLGEYHDVAKRPEYREIITAVRGILLKHIIATERPLPRVWPY